MLKNAKWITSPVDVGAAASTFTKKLDVKKEKNVSFHSKKTPFLRMYKKIIKNLIKVNTNSIFCAILYVASFLTLCEMEGA